MLLIIDILIQNEFIKNKIKLKIIIIINNDNYSF